MTSITAIDPDPKGSVPIGGGVGGAVALGVLVWAGADRLVAFVLYVLGHWSAPWT